METIRESFKMERETILKRNTYYKQRSQYTDGVLDAMSEYAEFVVNKKIKHLIDYMIHWEGRYPISAFISKAHELMTTAPNDEPSVATEDAILKKPDQQNSIH